MKLTPFWLFSLLIIGHTTVQAQNFAGDMALSKILIKGETWERLASGYGFADGAATDDEGNFYFSGRKNGTGSIVKIDPKGKVSVHIEDATGVSGLQLGTDGRFYATRWGKNDVVRFDDRGRMEIITKGDHPNDLVVTSQGQLFFTSSSGIFSLSQDRQVRLVAEGIKGANGISLSPDQGTLIISEYSGKHVWAYRVEQDGTLKYGEPYMTMRLPAGKGNAKGDGATTDIEGRYYITSALGIQMFDATGRISGIISKPTKDSISNVVFAGEGHRYLYVTSGGEIYRRLTKTSGLRFYEAFKNSTDSK